MKRILADYYYFYFKSRYFLLPVIFILFLILVKNNINNQIYFKYITIFSLLVIPFFLTYYKKMISLDNYQDLINSLPANNKFMKWHHLFIYLTNAILSLFLFSFSSYVISIVYAKKLLTEIRFPYNLAALSFLGGFAYFLLFWCLMFKSRRNASEYEEKINNMSLLLLFIPVIIISWIG